jgi:malate/lactate dehydrogenase
MQLGEVSLSLPAIINRDGVARVLSIPLSRSERHALEVSAEILKEHIAFGCFDTGDRLTRRIC